jgi:type I restriction enzyme S subunit
MTTTAEISREDAKPNKPNGWPTAKLADVCELVGDNVNPQEFPEETFAHYSIPAFDAQQKATIELGSAILSNKILFPVGAVLFSKLNPRIARVWHIADEQTHRRICSTEFLPLLPNLSVLDPAYLTFFMQEPELIAGLRARVAAATKSRERLKLEIVLSAEIPLPPLAEQKRIAVILKEQMAAVERARASAEAQLQAAGALPAAHLSAVFSSPEAQRWPRKRLGEIGSDDGCFADGPFGSNLKTEHYTTSGARVVRLQNIGRGEFLDSDKAYVSKEHFDSLQRHHVQPGDAIMAALGDGARPAGRACKIPDGFGPGLVKADCFRIRLPKTKVWPDFLVAVLNSPPCLASIAERMRGATRPRVTLNILREIETPLPPLADQRRIASQLSAQMASAERLRQTLAGQLDAINKLPAALLRRAFKGEL